MQTQNFKIREITPNAEFQLLNEIYNYYMNCDFSKNEKISIEYPDGVFEGSFIANELLLNKKGTSGLTYKTKKRIGFGSKNVGFAVSCYDITGCNPNNLHEIAKEIGADIKVIGKNNLLHFVKKSN